VIGLAVTREGIPIRVWTLPGNTADQALIRQVKDDLRAWKLGRVVWVTDRGFASAENRRYLQRAGGHYITGEKLRSESVEAKAAVARQGRYHTVAGNLEVKEVVLDEGVMRDRFVVCRTSSHAETSPRRGDTITPPGSGAAMTGATSRCISISRAPFSFPWEMRSGSIPAMRWRRRRSNSGPRSRVPVTNGTSTCSHVPASMTDPDTSISITDGNLRS
jgi:Transposase DDE domain